mmetsp:Transcript_18516/g.16397  ORF Transcript_18516/g.16397 Transcript_18516/m.16397 type:complete len:84 (+) Transcript_18516:626-877(+)
MSKYSNEVFASQENPENTKEKDNNQVEKYNKEKDFVKIIEKDSIKLISNKNIKYHSNTKKMAIHNKSGKKSKNRMLPPLENNY